MSDNPKWRRRAAARPGEIVNAALPIFAEHGYAATRLTDIAARAGVSKAALYLYFPTKLDLFRAVLDRQLSPRLEMVAALEDLADPGLGGLTSLLSIFADFLAVSERRKLVRIVIGESGNFPEVANAWRETVVSPALAALEQAISARQKAGQLRDGDPKLMAMSVVAPMVLGALWTEVMGSTGSEAVDLSALALEHGRTLIQGLSTTLVVRGTR